MKISKKLLIIYIGIFLFQMNSASCMIKKVECSVEIMPNYIWHLFAAANLWDREKPLYAEKYGHTVLKEDIDFLHQNRDYIVWGNGRSAMFTGLLFFIPFSGEITPENYFIYLDDVEKAARTSDWLNFMKKYCPQFIESSRNYSANEEQIATFVRIKEIIKKNFPRYQKEIWKDVKKVLDREKIKIDKSFANSSIIQSWEKALHMDYPANGFYPVLTFANTLDNLPSANNLSESRNNFAANELNTEHNIDLIIHEIGIFTFFPTLNSLNNDTSLQTKYAQSNGIVYQAIESYIEMKKEGITNKKKEWKGKLVGGGQFDFPWFFKYYEDNEGKYNARQLIYYAVKEYEKEHNK